MDAAVLLSLALAALYAFLLWTGWRRRPQTQEAAPAGTYRVAWRGFRRLNRLSIAVFLANPLSWLFLDIDSLEKSTVAALLVLWILSWAGIGIYAYEFFRCPRCGNAFWAFGRWTSRNCAHCGLRLYEGA
jgi:hypothetical protein